MKGVIVSLPLQQGNESREPITWSVNGDSPASCKATSVCISSRSGPVCVWELPDAPAAPNPEEPAFAKLKAILALSKAGEVVLALRFSK